MLRNVRAGNKEDLFDALVDSVGDTHPHLDLTDVMQRLAAREAEASTAFGQGIAMPHALVPGLDEDILVSAVLDEPFDYDGDGRSPVQVAFMLLSPADSPERHLQSLSNLARACQSEGFIGDLVQGIDGSDVFSLLSDSPDMGG